MSVACLALTFSGVTYIQSKFSFLSFHTELELVVWACTRTCSCMCGDREYKMVMKAVHSLLVWKKVIDFA